MTSCDVNARRNRPLSVAIVGSGPSGFYTAAALLQRKDYHVEVDMFDRLPTPYGLVRGGVAPDHEKIKGVSKAFEKSTLTPAFRFLGNIELGRDIQVMDLVIHYDQIVYAIGNEDDRRMGIPGESLTGCTPATVFVGWYNAHPDYTGARFDFTARRIAVVGMGNVAIDVARILARSKSELIHSDIPDYALEALEQRQIEEILILGRRGPIQAAFTPAELRELTTLTSARVVVDPQELVLDRHSQRELDEAGPSSQLRKNYETLSEISRNDTPTGSRIIRFRFLLSPIRILEGRDGRVGGMVLERNELFRTDTGALQARGTGRTETIDVGWVSASIGYELRRLPGLPYDEDRRVIANINGCSLVFTLLFSKLLREWFAPDTSSRMDSIGWTGRGLAG
jgi:ferredoxin--NADP+ reductase